MVERRGAGAVELAGAAGEREVAEHPSPTMVRIAVRETAVDNLRSRREALVERRDAVPSACPLAVAAHVSVG
jgi:hypothetical protein